MAVRFLGYEVADLCLGKPPLRSLSSCATIADAVDALKSGEGSFVSVWSCNHLSKRSQECVCVGKVCMVDVICYLCREDNLGSPGLALKSPVSVLVSKFKGSVKHVEPNSSLLESIDLILQGAQNLVVPIKSSTSFSSSKRKPIQKAAAICPTTHNGQEFCWLTQEDVIRFILSSIGSFSPIPTLSIDALSIISPEFLSVNYHSPASSALAAISQSSANQTSVAVLDDDGILVGEISPFALARCDETAAAAVLALTAGELMAYVDYGGNPPEEVSRMVQARLKERKLEALLDEFTGNSSNSSSSDEELASPTTTLLGSRRCSVGGSRWCGYLARVGRRADAIVCRGSNSLVAVMVQAIAHRVGYVWVTEDDGLVVGIVTFGNMLKVFHQHLESVLRGFLAEPTSQA